MADKRYVPVDGFDTPELQELRPYKAYCVIVLNALKRLDNDKGVTIGALHRTIGEDACIRKWTLDALVSIGARQMNTIPERYTFTNPIVMKVLTDGARMGIFPRPASKEVRPKG